MVDRRFELDLLVAGEGSSAGLVEIGSSVWDIIGLSCGDWVCEINAAWREEPDFRLHLPGDLQAAPRSA